MDFNELLQYCQAEAITSKLLPNPESMWRRICMEYSQKFHTPLHQVLELDPELVVLAYYEDQIRTWDVEEQLDNILDIIYSIEDPNYDIEKERQFREQIKRMEDEEKLRLERGDAIHPALAKEGIKPKKPKPIQENTPEEPKPPDNLPVSGGIQFDLGDDGNGKPNFE
jgi:hypothetical protein